MNILYYSNYCKHSQGIVQSLVKSNLADKLSFVCIDKRSRDPQNGQMHITLENGTKVIMPPNIHSVPSMLLIKDNYRIIMGDDILKYFHKDMKNNNSRNSSNITTTEPSGYLFSNNNIGGTNIMSEQFTSYDMTPDELSAKGNGGSRQMYNYVSVQNELNLINTPPDNYRPDKVSNDVTLDTLQQKRLDDIGQTDNVIPPALHI
tara:strand:- start:8580 stop:9191 length:612 start_codon:yes stop_codon:yes gene_type:complete